MRNARVRKLQRGNVIVGIIIGVVLGLAAALAVAVYVTKVPIPFLNKGGSRTPEQDAAETRKNQNWDPNAPLYGKNPAKPVPPAGIGGPIGAASQPASAAVAAKDKDKEKDKDKDKVDPVLRPPATRGADPIGDLAAARSGLPAGADPFMYFVQAGAFRTAEDAEAQRAKLSLMGIEAKVTEREQAGRQRRCSSTVQP